LILFNAAFDTASTEGKKLIASNNPLSSESEAYFEAMLDPPSKKRVANPGKRV
jgi:hypothetical protein